MKTHTSKKSNFRFLLMLFATVFTIAIQAQTKTWDGGAGTTNWGDAANWSPNGVPTASDNVILSRRSSFTVVVNIPNALCNNLTIGTNEEAIVTLQFSSNGQLTVTNTVTLGTDTDPEHQPKIDMTNGGILKAGSLSVVNNNSIFTPGSGTVELTSNNTIPNFFTRFNNLSILSGNTVFPTITTIDGQLNISTGANVTLSNSRPLSSPYNVHSLVMGNSPHGIGTYGGSSSAASTKNSTFFGTTNVGVIRTAALGYLPVLLTSFTVKNSAINNVILSWSTSSEIVNKGFSIERQTNSANGKFESIGFVASKAPGGNSQTPLYYSFTDEMPNASATNFYRLAQQDLDGKISYSDIRSVKLGKETVTMLFPNPSNGVVNISRSNNGKKMNIIVVDQSGRMINQINGITDPNYKISNLRPGIYTIRMTYPETGEQSVQKVVVQK